MGIEVIPRSAVSRNTEVKRGLDGRRRGLDAAMCRVCSDGASAARSAWRDARKRLLLALVAEEPTVGLTVLGHLSSSVASGRWRCANRMAARQNIDDDHRCAAVPADEGGGPGCRRRFIACARDGRRVQQRSYPREVVPPHRIGQQSIVADAVEATG